MSFHFKMKHPSLWVKSLVPPKPFGK